MNHDDDDDSRIIYTFVLGQSAQCILISFTSLGTHFCLETKFSLKESIYSIQKLRQIGYGVYVYVLIIFRTPGGVYKKISDCCHDIHIIIINNQPTDNVAQCIYHINMQKTLYSIFTNI